VRAYLLGLRGGLLVHGGRFRGFRHHGAAAVVLRACANRRRRLHDRRCLRPVRVLLDLVERLDEPQARDFTVAVFVQPLEQCQDLLVRQVEREEDAQRVGQLRLVDDTVAVLR
jgi:hypothetical protein